jgi:hypothetical protein
MRRRLVFALLAAVCLAAVAAAAPGCGSKVRPAKTTTATTITTPTSPTSPATTAPETAPTSPTTQRQVIEDYAADNSIALDGVGGRPLAISLYKTSRIDPDWQLWQMPLGEGLDVHYFILHGKNGQWTVAGDFFQNLNPQEFGAPSDLAINP